MRSNFYTALFFQKTSFPPFPHVLQKSKYSVLPILLNHPGKYLQKVLTSAKSSVLTDFGETGKSHDPRPCMGWGADLMKNLAFTGNKITGFLLGFILTLSLTGCASLADFKELDGDPRIGQKTPQIVGSKGELPTQTSKAILDRMKNESGSTEILYF